MQLFREGEQKNYWVRRNRIPLGKNVYDESEVYKIMPKISDSALIAASPGRGKSVTFRLLHFFISLVRPTIMFDWEGEDHKLSYYPNTQAENLPQFTQPSPLYKGKYFSYKSQLSMGSDIEEYENLVVPNICNYSSDELRGMGFPTGASMELVRIIKDYGPFTKLTELNDFIKGFPTNASESVRAYRHSIYSKRPYRENDSMPSQTKQSLLKYLFRIIEKNLFALNDDKVPLYLEMMKKGYNLVLNFNGDKDMSRVEVARVLADIINDRKKHPDSIAPGLFYEEADTFMPRAVTDSEEKKKIEYICSQQINSYLRARKLGIGQYLCCPSLSSLHPKIIDATNEKIFGEMAGFDLGEVRRCTSDFVLQQVMSIKFNRFKNIREFVYVNEFKNVFKFRPYECPQDMHREYTGHKTKTEDENND